MENLGADIFGRKNNPLTETTSVEKPTLPMGSPAKIKVIGVGGGGGNAVERMIQSGFDGVEFWAMNTDLQVLTPSLAPNKLQIGAKLTGGLGAGNDPQKGEKAAEEAQQEITAALEGADMVFVTAGMGGGTGTGAAPVIARIAKDLGILTVAVVTKPFGFEGQRRMAQATQGIEKLRDAVDSLLVIPNDKLFEVVDRKRGAVDSFVVVNEVLLRGVKGISDIITKKGLINVDFADIKSVMLDSGSAVMGIGYAEGEGRALEATKIAINSKLLETSIKGASGAVVNITGSPDMGIYEIADAVSLIEESLLDDAKLIIGMIFDEKMQSGISVTVVATGLDLQPSTPSLQGNSGELVAPNIDDLFSGLNSTSSTPLQAPSFGTASAPTMPAMQSFGSNIEIPEFLKK